VINLRFHIVSIVAIFLALAIGLLTGTTLLEGSTVKVYKSAQESLDRKNDALSERNQQLVEALDALDRNNNVFPSEILPALASTDRLSGSILTIASRGIDEDTVAVTQKLLEETGAESLGVIWLDERSDTSDAATAKTVLDALDLLASGKDAKSKVLDTVAAALLSATGTEPVSLGAVTVSTTTTTIADSSGTGTTGEPAANPEPIPVPGIEPSTADDLFSKLIEKGIVDWSPPAGSGNPTLVLPKAATRVLFLTGEGAEVAPNRVIYPLIERMAPKVAGLIIAEVDTRRGTVEAIDSATTERRGFAVEYFRGDRPLVDRVITIDNLDRPYGQVALLLALASEEALASGAFGEGKSASRAYPEPRR
jgi:hypothetical protein